MTAITASTTTAKDAFLRLTMRLDAVVSGAVGLAALALAPRIAALSGTSAAFEYSTGAVFVVYGSAVYALARVPDVRTPGIAVVVANVIFTVAAVATVLAGVWPLTTTGVVLTMGSAVYTLVMADLQYLGLRRMRV